jgi:hypothetical protein
LRSVAIEDQSTTRFGWVLAGGGEARRAPIGVRLAGAAEFNLATMAPHMPSAEPAFVRVATAFVRTCARSTSANSTSSSAEVRGTRPARFLLALMLLAWIAATEAARVGFGMLVSSMKGGDVCAFGLDAFARALVVAELDPDA